MYNEVPILLWNLINPLGFLRAKAITRKRKRMGKIELNLKSKFIRIIKKSRDIFNIRSLQEIKIENLFFTRHLSLIVLPSNTIPTWHSTSSPTPPKPIISLSSPLIHRAERQRRNKYKIEIKKKKKIKTRLPSNLVKLGQIFNIQRSPFHFCFSSTRAGGTEKELLIKVKSAKALWKKFRLIDSH